LVLEYPAIRGCLCMVREVRVTATYFGNISPVSETKS
jgi:hypothetical protein